MNNNDAFITIPIDNQIPLSDTKVCICIDISGSTNNKIDSQLSILEAEIKFATDLSSKLTQETKLIAWDNKAEHIIDMQYLKPRNGTEPSCIFNNITTHSDIRESDVAVIITDGEIGANEISNFSKAMLTHGTHLKAIIGVIVKKINTGLPFPSEQSLSHFLNSGIRLSKDVLNHKPADVQISVLVPAMIGNSCIILNDGTNNFVMWSSSIFRSEWNPNEVIDITNWEDVSKISFDVLAKTLIPFPNQQQDIELREQNYIPIGTGLYFNPELLLQWNPTLDELINIPFDRISQYFRVSMRCCELVDWFKKQKNRFLEEFIVEPNERMNIEQIMTDMERNRQNRQIYDSLLPYFTQIRNQALVRRYIDDDDIDNVVDDPRIKQVIIFFRQMLDVMMEDMENQDDGNSYVSSSIALSRYSTVPSNHSSKYVSSYSKTNPTSITANFKDPLKWIEQFCRLYPNHESKQHECSICCDINIPFVLMRKVINKLNIDDFQVHPLDYFYPEIMCAKCATYFCNNKIDPVRVECFAAIPLITLVDDSKKYFISSFTELSGTVINNSNIIGSIKTTTKYLLNYLSNISMGIITKKNYVDEIAALIDIFFEILNNHFRNSADIVSILKNIMNNLF